MSQVTCKPNQAVNPFFFADSFFREFEKAEIQRTFKPRVDVLQKEKSSVVVVDLPGVSKESIDIQVEKGVLHIKGERPAPEFEEGSEYYLRERGYGNFERRFRLGESLDPEAVQAKFENGVLAVEINRKEESLARKVEVN